MNMNQNQLGNKRLEKLALEQTGLDGCRADMSDVSFEIGKSSDTIKIFGAIIAFAVFFGARIIPRRMIGNPEYRFSAIDFAFWGFIGILTVCIIVGAIVQSRRPGISVSGKTIFSGGNCWTSDEISCVKCTRWLEILEVYSGGEKILSIPWELDNSELFIAWTNKCGILFEDNRMKRN